jgi:glycosyltransferase involved in cell wall biosynthesis
MFREFKPDVVHTHHFYELFYAWPGALLCGAQLVHTEHEFHSLSETKICRRLRVLSFFCRRVTAVNEETAIYLREVVKIPAHKVVMVANGIDLDCFSDVEDKRDDLQLPADYPVIGIVARLESVKNHTMLIRAFRRVVDDIPDTRLLVVGDGSLRPDLIKLAGQLKLTEQIIFLGERRDIPELLATLDLFVLSSDREGLPVALLEAMATGLPIVATAAGGIPSVIDDGENGLLITPGDEEGLAAGIKKVLMDFQFGRQLGENAKSFVTEHFSLARVLKQYMRLYSKDTMSDDVEDK